MVLCLQPCRNLERKMACHAQCFWRPMSQRIPNVAQVFSFIGAGLTLVAHGASAAVGLVEQDEACCPINVLLPTMDDLCSNRLEIFASPEG